MSFWDYVLPWKAIPNMAKDVKAAWSGDGKNRHDSFVGAIGKYADPFGALLGEDVQNFMHGTIPREINRALEPVGKFHRDNLDPIYKVAGDTEWGKAITDQGVNKGGDWSALIAAAVAGAGAAAGGAAGSASGAGGAGAGGMSAFGPYAGGYAFPAGSSAAGYSAAGPWASGYVFPGVAGTSVGTGSMAGAAGGTASAATPAASSSKSLASMDWSDPKTYMDLYKQFGGSMPGGQQQPPPQQSEYERILPEHYQRRPVYYT